MDNEAYRHALGLIESASPTKGKAALDAAIEAAKQEERKQIATDLTYGRNIYEIGIAGRIPIRKYLEALKRGERPEE